MKLFRDTTPITSPFHSRCFSHPHSVLHYVTLAANEMLQLEVIKTPAALQILHFLSLPINMLSLPLTGAVRTGTNLGASNPVCCIFPYAIRAAFRDPLRRVYGCVLPPCGLFKELFFNVSSQFVQQQQFGAYLSSNAFTPTSVIF